MTSETRHAVWEYAAELALAAGKFVTAGTQLVLFFVLSGFLISSFVLPKPGSTEPATRFGCRDTQTGAPLKLG